MSIEGGGGGWLSRLGSSGLGLGLVGFEGKRLGCIFCDERSESDDWC